MDDNYDGVDSAPSFDYEGNQLGLSAQEMIGSGKLKGRSMTLSSKHEYHVHHRKYSVPYTPSGTIFSSFANLLNTIVGSGILGLPFAFANSGWVLGTILMILSGLASAFGLQLLALCALKLHPPVNLYDVAEIAVPNFAWLVDLAVVISSFGACISYLIVIGDLIPQVLKEFGAPHFWSNRTFWVCAGFAIVSPLCMFRTLTALESVSTFCMVCVAFITLLLAMFALRAGDLDPCEHMSSADCPGEQELFVTNYSTLRVFSIFIFAFSCHANIFPIAAELIAPTPRRMDWVIGLSIGTAFVVYMVVALSGYEAYGNDVDPNILVTFPDIPVVAVGRIAIASIVACSYPVLLNPARKVTMAVLAHLDPEGVEISHNVLLFRFYAFTVIFMIISLVIALAVDDISIILSIVGATASTIQAFILPGIGYVKIFKEDGWTAKRIAALCMFFLGFLIMPICLAMNFV